MKYAIIDIFMALFVFMTLFISHESSASQPAEQFLSQLSEQFSRQRYPFPDFQVARFASCSEGPVDIVPLRDDSEEFVLVSNNLNQKCFRKISRELAEFLFENTDNRKEDAFLDPILYEFGLEFERKNSQHTNFPHEIVNTLSPLELSCSEKCRYSNQQLVKIAETYYFLLYSSDYGIEARMITDDLILFQIHMATHTRNVTFNRALSKPVQFPDGDLEFLPDSVIVRRKKSYFKDVGGAFWYDMRVNFNGEIIEYLDVEDGLCVDRNKFYESTENRLIAAGKDQLCVYP